MSFGNTVTRRPAGFLSNTTFMYRFAHSERDLMLSLESWIKEKPGRDTSWPRSVRQRAAARRPAAHPWFSRAVRGGSLRGPDLSRGHPLRLRYALANPYRGL